MSALKYSDQEVLLAKERLDSLIKKSRAHLYKPMQIAEILYQNRTGSSIDLLNKESYRSVSKQWRDVVTKRLVGRASTSSSKFQDNLFDDNAIPPKVLDVLGEYNNSRQGLVESYIYGMLSKRLSQFSAGIDYCESKSIEDFFLRDFIEIFRKDAGLKRSVDKIYEIVVYALFNAIITALNVRVSVSLDPEKKGLLDDFSDFSDKVIGVRPADLYIDDVGKIGRMGVTNAADRGLDIWSNFGVVVQVKHLSLTEEEAEQITQVVSADRIVIVCKKAEKGVIVSLLTKIGWRSRIQSVITENELEDWYERALRGKYKALMGEIILNALRQEIHKEFPSLNGELEAFCDERGYGKVKLDGIWKLS